jgi:raffinose/stachyose/melibiose transport system substrate-binding protein
MATKKFGQLYTDTVKQISPVPGVSPKDPLLGEMLANYRANPEPYLMLIDFRYGDPSGTDLLGNQLQRMLLGQTDASGAAASTTKGLSAWFRPSGS